MLPPEVGELIGMNTDSDFNTKDKIDRFSNCTEVLTKEMIESSYRDDLSF